MIVYRLRYILPLGTNIRSPHIPSRFTSHNGSRFVRLQRLSLCVSVFGADPQGSRICAIMEMDYTG